MVINVTKYYRSTVFAYSKGFRVTEDGTFLDYRGNPKELKLYDRYPVFGVYMEGRIYTVQVHKFAAYCFYGDRAFEVGKHARHLNGNVFDISKKNIVMGTPAENIADQPLKVRLETLNKAWRAARKLTDGQVREIRRIDWKNTTASCLSAKYGVCSKTIRRVRNRLSYKDVL